MKHEATLTEGSIARHLAVLTGPMIGGMFAMMAFNLTDTYFVSRLGTNELAAMSFTFPVVMFIGAIGLGLGNGTASVIARAIGEGNQERVKRLATDSLMLTVIIVGACAAMGLVTMRPLFRLLGATDNVLPLVMRYMTLWYSCVAVLIIPMVGNHAIRATGDTLRPGIIMVISALLNVVLDPIMIFGLFGFPRLELFGAALATVTARALGLVAALWILHRRCKLLDLSVPTLRGSLASWRSILHVGAPSAATHLLMPVTRSVLTRLAAGFGTSAVAAVGAGTRIEGFSMIVPIALGSTLVPIIGQNWGARLYSRATRARLYAYAFGGVWGTLCVGVFIVAARPIAGLFSTEPAVLEALTWYLRIVPFGHLLLHCSAYTSFALNAIGKPIDAALQSLVRGGAVIMFAALGARLFGLNGLFGGLAAAQLTAGVIAVAWARRACAAPAFDDAGPVPVFDS